MGYAPKNNQSMGFWVQVFGTAVSQFVQQIVPDREQHEDLVLAPSTDEDAEAKMKKLIATASSYADLAAEEVDNKMRAAQIQQQLAASNGPDPSAGGPLGMRGIQ